jgi:hypothetical protein
MEAALAVVQVARHTAIMACQSALRGVVSKYFPACTDVEKRTPKKPANTDDFRLKSGS